MRKTPKKNDEMLFLFSDGDETQSASETFGKSGIINPVALTPDEIQSHPTKRYDSANALETLKKRMAATINKASDNYDAPDKTEDVLPNSSFVSKQAETKSNNASQPAMITKKQQPAPLKQSLVDKCMPYILDDDGNDASIDREPLYKLESVAEILKSDSKKSMKSLSEKYNIDLEPSKGYINYVEDKAEPTAKETVTADTHDDLPAESNQKTISDIDYSRANNTVSSVSQDSATITFTPITYKQSEKPKVAVSSHTKSLNITSEILKISLPEKESFENDTQLESSEFEDFVPENELNDNESAKQLLRQLTIKRRNTFLSLLGSIVFTLATVFMRLPFMSETLLAHTGTSMIICSAFALAVIILNGDMFVSVPLIFSRRSTPDAPVSVASLSTVIYAIFAILTGEIIIDMLLLISIILCFRALTGFLDATRMLTTFKLAASPVAKNAIKLISDPAITFAMAKDAIEGDTLIAASTPCDKIKDFMKYSRFKIILNGKLRIINIMSILLSVIMGITCANYFDGLLYGFYAATAVTCFACLPTLFFIDIIPLYRSSDKLGRINAAILGKVGAEQTEMANAVVLNSESLFPSGTVTLHRMQVLSENDLQDTIIRAASLTDALNSTLAPIFKKIAGTGNITVFPDSDTVKYEDRMGISGWVDNRLLFIGNRTLMEAHGISVPSVEVDRKILRQGYFPVYVATQDTACALLIIQYQVDPKVSYELRRLTRLGVTVLVNNTDPNLTEEMICDYLGLYHDSVKVMTAAGCHIHKNSVVPVKKSSAPAFFRNNPLALPAIINCASKIKRSNVILTIAYVISAVFGALFFAYSSFGGSGTLISDTALLLYTIISTAVSYLLYLTERP